MRKSVIITLLFFSFALLSPGVDFEHDSVWKGEIVISKPLLLKAGRKITIQPGSRVIFTSDGRLEMKFGTLSVENCSFEAEKSKGGEIYLSFFRSSVKFRNCSFKNLCKGKKLYNMNIALNAVYGDTMISGCRFENTAAIQAFLSNSSRFERNIFRHPVGFGLHIYRCRSGLVSGNVFDAGKETSSSLVLSANNAYRTVSNFFYGNSTGITLRYGSRDACILNNVFLNPKFGIYTYGKIRDCLIICNTIISPGFYGINVKDCDSGNIVSNNLITNCKYSGIQIVKAKNLVIEDCVITNCSNGIIVYKDAAGVNVRHNLFWKNKTNINAKSDSVKVNNNINAAPLFISAENFDFRPQLKSRGYPADSPLTGKDFPDGKPVGLYPGMKAD